MNVMESRVLDRLAASNVLLVGLPFLSGLSALLYEVVWLRMLARAFGSTTFATSGVVAIFMAGLAGGAYAAGRLSQRANMPLAWYGAVEAALVLLGAASTYAALRLPEIYSLLAIQAPANSPQVVAIRCSLAFAVLLAPTVLMGMTFPLLAEHCSRLKNPSTLFAPAWLYGANTLGAVCGVLLAGFHTLGTWGETRTVGLAAALNALVGAAALFAATRGAPGHERMRGEPPAQARPAPTGSRWAPWLAAGTSFCALALEVLWARLFILLAGTSVYAFCSVLASYLAGLGLGSLVGARWIPSERKPSRAFSALQILLGVVLVATFELYFQHGKRRLDPSYLYSPLQSLWDFADIFCISAALIGPVTFLYGLSFPLAIRWAGPAGRGGDVGRLSAFSTLGGVFGALACGFVLIPALGTQHSLFALSLLHFGLAGIAAWLARSKAMGWISGSAGAAVLVLALWRPDPFLSILQARLHVKEVDFHKEGSSATVTFARGAYLVINGIVVSGKGQIGEFMGHFPLILHPSPRRALVVCLGVGNTLRAVVDHQVDVDLVELEPEVVTAFSRIWPDAARYLQHPRVQVWVEDGRNFLLTSRRGYDAIVVDGSPPIFSAGTVNLYSREFMDLAARRLTPRGIFGLWVPLPCFESDLWGIAHNLTRVFPHTALWAWPGMPGRVPGFLLLGSHQPLEMDPHVLVQRAKERGLSKKYPWLGHALSAHRHILQDERLRTLSLDYPAVTDDHPYTEFPLPQFWKGAPFETDSAFAFSTR